MLLAASIEKEETNIGYVKLLKNLIKKHGCPNLIKTDKRKTFWSHDSKTNMTQCLNNLEIEVESRSEPTFKPNVERSFRSDQDFYPFYFYSNNINSYKDLENNIEKIIDAYNTQFSKSNSNKENTFTKVSEKRIDKAFYLTKECKVHKGFYITFQNKKLALITEDGKRCTMKNFIKLHIDMLTNELFTIINNETFYFKEISDDLIDTYKEEMFQNHIFEFEKEKLKFKKQTMSIRKKLDKKEAYLIAKEKELKRQELIILNR